MDIASANRENCELWPSPHIAGIASFCCPSRAMLARFTSPIGFGGTSAPATQPVRGEQASSDAASQRNRIWPTSTALPVPSGSDVFLLDKSQINGIYHILPTVASTDEHVNMTMAQGHMSASPASKSKSESESERKNIERRALRR